MPTIRPARPEDAPAIAAVYAPFVSETAISFEITPPDAEEMSRRMTACMAVYPWLVAEDGGRIAGYAYAGRYSGRAAYDWAVEVTVYLHPDYHRKHVGRHLYQTLFAILRRQGVHSVFAIITLPNDASVGLHRASGMREIGIYREVGFKFGEWRDVLSMGMTLSDRALPIGPLIPFPQLTLDRQDFE
ncbi:hypothetical protein A1351_00550 [Methylosinus sp. R-45379]|uniref:GNAT family N-acetyltransferase n=1 Tax=Methylosinus sp. R-45379 TaxID=980563 RepID=UPI0007C934B0|nr:GNAT family N-acetyltransferase [Methylosinus sp. R-45379]OAI30856.1 hypothetical protein A1351_00550 [Methylosinus sp. R-45379]